MDFFVCWPYVQQPRQNSVSLYTVILPVTDNHFLSLSIILSFIFLALRYWLGLLLQC